MPVWPRSFVPQQNVPPLIASRQAPSPTPLEIDNACSVLSVRRGTVSRHPVFHVCQSPACPRLQFLLPPQHHVARFASRPQVKPKAALICLHIWLPSTGVGPAGSALLRPLPSSPLS